MPRSFPSQIADYLSKVFATREHPLDSAIIYSKIGAVAGFLELYDELPHELIRLPGEDYAALVEAIATVRLGIDKFRITNKGDLFTPVGRELRKAWELIEQLRDEVPSTGHDLSFITDPVLEEMIRMDHSAIANALQSGEWKGATILAGSCCEAPLLYGLQTKESRVPGTISKAVSAIRWSGKSPNPTDLLDKSWDLFSYAEVARGAQLISGSTKSELDAARDYRNLIHPAKTFREKVKSDLGTAYVGAGAVEHVIGDLRRNL